MARVILHVHMDAFFASVEQREHPELRGKPVIVGSAPDERGVVATCSYEARRYGVHSAMPSRTAYSRCPQVVFVRPDMKLYRRASEEVFAVFEEFSPFVEQVSVDEAFLDISGCVQHFGSPENLGHALRGKVRERCRLSCSVGIAPNRLLAKIASDVNKPDGFFMMPFEREGIREFLAPRKVGILWGVGGKTQEILMRYGYRTCRDIQNASPTALATILGETAAATVFAHASGIDASPVQWQDRAEKSVSREWTFLQDCTSRDAVRAKLLELVCEVGRRFRREKRWARTGFIKLRNASFDTITRQAPFPSPVCDDISFRHLMLELFDREWPRSASRSIRLAGWGVTNFTSSPESFAESFFEAPGALSPEIRRKRELLSSAIDALPSAGSIVNAAPPLPGILHLQ